MANPRFIHLRVHTEYSLLEGAVPVKALVKTCEKRGMPAVAITDTNALFAALEFSVVAKGAGVQPIVGCQIDVQLPARQPGERPRPGAPLVLLAQNERGYENLMLLNSCLYLRTDGSLPHVTPAEIARHAEGLICLTGGPDGLVGRLIRDGQMPRAQELMDFLAATYGDRLYVELQRHPGEGGALTPAEQATERPFLEMAYAMNLPIVATNDVYFPEAKMFEAHDALLCIKEGAYVDQQEPRRRLTPQHYLKSPEEMAALFADLPEALENTVEFTVVQPSRAMVNAPDALLVFERNLNGAIEQKIILPNATAVRGDNLLHIRAQTGRSAELTRFDFDEMRARFGGLPPPFERVSASGLNTGTDALGSYVYATESVGASTLCVLVLRRMGVGARPLPRGTQALDVMMRNCVNGSLEQALEPMSGRAFGVGGASGTMLRGRLPSTTTGSRKAMWLIMMIAGPLRGRCSSPVTSTSRAPRRVFSSVA